MKVFITRPAQPLHPLEERIISLWRRQYDNVEVIQAEPFEIHGDLLTRLWSDIRSSDEPEIIISESDFVPLPTIAWPPNIAAVFTTYCHQHLSFPTITPCRPYSAGWYMRFNRSLFKAEPALDWLSASGPFNDAANFAYLRAHLTGVLDWSNSLLIEPMNTFHGKELLRCLRYPFGTHLFWTRHWYEPKKRLYPDGYTVADHLAAASAMLKNLEPIL
jgi:hypothetical protein